ncbi:MAG: hypothetical protein J6C41_08680 [Oscillospiraceae bacterium]|nr:hypothetical protein [Oscillospiraceae bacterium]
MKKRFCIYATAWAVLLALFNVIAFVSPGCIWVEKYDAVFWIGYAFITVTFLGQLACAWYALKEERATKLFYKVSLITTSYTGLIVTFVIGGLCMLISPLPYWIGILVCSIVLATNVLAVIKTAAAIEDVQTIDEKVKVQTGFIKMLAVDAEGLISRAKSETIKAECKKVYESVRYSDPMSQDSLSRIEEQLSEQFAKLSKAIDDDRTDLVLAITADFLALLSERNKKCKLLK